MQQCNAMFLVTILYIKKPILLLQVVHLTVCRVILILSQMETATISNESFHSATNEGGSGPTTYSRGYQPLLQEDSDISFTHDPRNTASQEPIMMQTLPPNSPKTQSSQYTPAPPSFNPQQQSSSVRFYRYHFETINSMLKKEIMKLL